MAENRDVTPEKQLLRLIEGSGGKGAVEEAKVERAGRGFLSLGALKGRFSFFKRSAAKQSVHTRKFSLSLASANRVLALVAAALLVYVASDAFTSYGRAAHPPQFGLEKDKTFAYVPPQSAVLHEAAYYMDKVSSRDIFHEKRPVLEKKKAAAPAVDNSATKKFSLVGISWSANPDAIIEDKERSKTYFVKRGQLIGDNVKVEAIFKDKVVLSKDDQEFELR